MSDKLHITVMTSPTTSLIQDRLDITQDIRLLKTAMLYADDVKFYSLVSHVFARLLYMDGLSDDKFFYEFLETEKNEIWLSGINVYKDLQGKNPRSAEENEFYIYVSAALRNITVDARSKIRETVEKAGLLSLKVALASGILDMPIFEYSDPEAMIEKLVEDVNKAALSGETYPLYDNETARLMYWATKAGILIRGEIATKRAQQISLASDLLKRLPLFDASPVDEIIDIRKELQKPLVGFRSAIIKFSRDISSATWDGEFQLEAEQVLREHIEPAILEIEDLCQSNKFLLNFLPKFATRGVVSSSALGIFLAHSSQFPEIVTAAGLVGGVSLATLEALREQREKQNLVENNQLYFYYKAGKMLSNS